MDPVVNADDVNADFRAPEPVYQAAQLVCLGG